MTCFNSKPISSLCRVDSDLSVHTLLTDICCSNGLCFSPDGRIMYFADTPKAVIWRFDYDIDTGVPSNRQVFATFDDHLALRTVPVLMRMAVCGTHNGMAAG
jgi:sugar lactone lactonase YvrE